MEAFQIPQRAFPLYAFPLYSWPIPGVTLTAEELLCLCEYGYTKGQVWQPGGQCPPGYDPSHPRRDEGDGAIWRAGS